MKQDLIHIKEAARLLGVTRQAVYKKLQSHGLKPQKVGNKAFIDKDTLRAIKEGKKVSAQVAESVTTATKQVDNELINLLRQQLDEIKNDKANLQRQVEIKDRQIEDLSTSGSEMRLLLGAAQKQIAGLLPSPVEPPKPVYEPPPPDHNQPELKPKKSKKKKKKKKR
jgi:excisionase family DNA binding protein